VNPIDEDVKDEIRGWAHAAEEAGEIVNRRALAREFGVSPQTVARALDGPGARRGEAGGSAWGASGVSRPAALAGMLVGVGLAALAVCRAGRAERKRHQG